MSIGDAKVILFLEDFWANKIVKANIMEIVVVTKSRNIGLDEDVTELRDIDYFSVLPKFTRCIGLLSLKSMKMLKKNRQNEVENNILDRLKIRNKYFLTNQSKDFLLYDIRNIKPVLYEVLGYNCIINFKGINYQVLESLKSFFFKDSGFTKEDFNNLELNTDYLISSYYEGEASFLYTNDRLVPIILENFNRICVENCGSKITVEDLE